MKPNLGIKIKFIIMFKTAQIGKIIPKYFVLFFNNIPGVAICML